MMALQLRALLSRRAMLAAENRPCAGSSVRIAGAAQSSTLTCY